MRCPDCMKFVSFDADDEPEGDDPCITVAPDGLSASINGEVRRELKCADCGTTLKSGTFTLDVDVDLPDEPCLTDEQKKEQAAKPPVDDADEEASHDVHEHDWEVEWNLDNTERMNDMDRNGRKITNHRYMTHMYGVVADGTVTCSNCGLSVDFSCDDEMASSSFDEEC